VQVPMGIGQSVHERPLRAGQVPARFQVVSQSSGLVEYPGLESGDELDLVDQAILKRQYPRSR
jgi:hypothetical protein